MFKRVFHLLLSTFVLEKLKAKVESRCRAELTPSVFSLALLRSTTSATLTPSLPNARALVQQHSNTSVDDECDCGAADAGCSATKARRPSSLCRSSCSLCTISQAPAIVSSRSSATRSYSSHSRAAGELAVAVAIAVGGRRCGGRGARFVCRRCSSSSSRGDDERHGARKGSHRRSHCHSPQCGGVGAAPGRATRGAAGGLAQEGREEGQQGGNPFSLLPSRDQRERHQMLLG